MSAKTGRMDSALGGKASERGSVEREDEHCLVAIERRTRPTREIADPVKRRDRDQPPSRVGNGIEQAKTSVEADERRVDASDDRGAVDGDCAEDGIDRAGGDGMEAQIADLPERRLFKQPHSSTQESLDDPTAVAAWSLGGSEDPLDGGTRPLQEIAEFPEREEADRNVVAKAIALDGPWVETDGLGDISRRVAQHRHPTDAPIASDCASH